MGAAALSKLTQEKRAEFLARLADGESVTAGARFIGLTRQALYQTRGHDAEFAAAWDDAIEQGTDILEDEAIKRARNSSDTLLIFMLKARRPDKFKDRSTVEHSGEILTKEARDAAHSAALNADR